MPTSSPVRLSSSTTGNSTRDSPAVSAFGMWLPVNAGTTRPATSVHTTVSAPSAIRITQNSVDGDAERLALAALAEQFGEHRHERRRQRRLREQVAEQVRDLRGERERRRRGGCREVRGLDDLAPETGDSRKRGGEREDRRVVGDAPARRRRLRRGPGEVRRVRSGGVGGTPLPRSLVWCRSVPGLAIVGRAAARNAAAYLCLWRTSSHRRSGSFAPSASDSRTAATRRRSRRTSAGSRRPSPPATAARPDTEHRELVQAIDKAVKRGALHRNSGARKKSRAARVRRG